MGAASGTWGPTTHEGRTDMQTHPTSQPTPPDRRSVWTLVAVALLLALLVTVIELAKATA